jgi:hypothetical protein
MNPFRNLFRATSRKSSSIRRPPRRLRAQLALEALETRLVPVIGIIRPPIGGIVLPEFVVPVSQPTDSSHFHSLSDAVGVLANPLPAGTHLIITIEPGASPDNTLVFVKAGGVTIQGESNVPAAILPSEQIQLYGADYTLTNLNLDSLTLGTSPGDPSTAGNLVSKCLIKSLIERGIHSTFTQNTITGSAEFDGLQYYEYDQIYNTTDFVTNKDVMTDNAFTGEADPLLKVTDCDGTVISQNSFYCPTTAISMLNCGGEEGDCAVENNKVFTSGAASTGILIRQEDSSQEHPGAPAGNGSAGVFVENNTINTNGGTGLSLSCAVGTNGGDFFIFAFGNDFHNNAVGVRVSGDGTNYGDVDLHYGGNDFRGFTTIGTASAAAIVLTNTSPTAVLSAPNNMFSPGVSPSFVVDDGVEGSLTGTGQIDAAAKLDDAHAFVQGVYNDLLGRTGSLAELNAWVNVFNAQGQAAVANGILRSSESLGRIVDTFYLRFLGRQSDAAGRAGWINILQHGASLESVEAGFITSPEYLGRIDTDFVQSLYINLLGRTGSAAELALWNNDIQTVGLAGIANAFLTSQEYRADNVSADFTSFLHRPPSPTEISAFVAMPTDLLGIEAAILSSQECFTNI